MVLKVGADPSGANAREVTVVPVADESQAAQPGVDRRQPAQSGPADQRPRRVRLHAGHRFRRLHQLQRATSSRKWARRRPSSTSGFNHGGALGTDIIEYLQRQLMSVVTTRDGADVVQPQGAIFGPKVMIINEFAGSGGDAMPWYFRRAGVGKLIGKRTWGGLVGLRIPPSDGWRLCARADLAVWNPDGNLTWRTAASRRTSR